MLLVENKSFEDLLNQKFVVLDVETTGLSPKTGDRIIEIALMKTKGFEIQERYSQLVDPERDISFGAYFINNISQEMLHNAPKTRDVLETVFGHLEDAIVVGHNISFDLGFLQNECQLAGHRGLDGISALDTRRMAKFFMPGRNGYSLAKVAHYLEVAQSARHRALVDVEATFEVFKKILSLVPPPQMTEFLKYSQVAFR